MSVSGNNVAPRRITGTNFAYVEGTFIKFFGVIGSFGGDNLIQIDTTGTGNAATVNLSGLLGLERDVSQAICKAVVQGTRDVQLNPILACVMCGMSKGLKPYHLRLAIETVDDDDQVVRIPWSRFVIVVRPLRPGDPDEDNIL